MFKIFIKVILFLTYLSKTVLGKVNQSGINNEIVKIFGVSTSISQLNYAPKGSIMGGTLVYITCVNHDMVASNNQINIGPYPCIIPEKGVGSNTITCRTTEAFDPLRRINQPVELFVRDKSQADCEGTCLFSYEDDATPFLKYVQPSVSVPDRDVSWTGLYRVSNTIDIKKFIIKNDKSGEFNCNRFQLEDVIGAQPLNLNDDQSINANYYQDVLCTVSEEQVAGIYDVNIETRWGTPANLQTSKMVTVDGEQEYSFVLTSEILGLSANQGGNKGNVLEIQGRGFGFDKTSVSVDVGGLNCEVQNINNEYIKCLLEEGDVDSNSNIRGQGLRKTIYNLNNGYNDLPDINKSADAFFGYIQNGQIQDRIVSDEQYGNWEVSSLSERHGVHMRGFFKAPRDGEYVFWNSADDYSNIYLNQTPDIASITADDLINKRSGHSWRRYYNHPNTSGNKSKSITLEKDKFYWLEAYAVNGGSAGHFTLSVEAPENPKATILTNTVTEISQYSIVPEVQNQIWSLMVWDDETQFGLKFFKQDPETREILLNASTSQNKCSDWTDSVLQSQINSAVGFSPVVKGYALDSKGLRCATVNGEEDGDVDPNCLIKGRQWLIEFTQYRTGDKSVAPQMTKQIKNSDLQLYQQQYQNVIGGYYHMAINGVLLEVYTNNQWTDKIPYNAHAGHIQSGINRIFNELSLETYTTGEADTGYTIVINFKTTNSKLQGDINIVFENHLEGQKPGSIPEIVLTEVQKASQRPFYEPIPYDMSYQESQSPSVLVTVNGVLSAVDINADNSYITDANLNPVVSSFSVSGTQLTLDLSNTQQQDFDASDVQINFGGSVCNNIDIANLSAVTCDLVSEIEGGNHVPQVYVEGLGFQENQGLTPQNVQVLISSVSPDTGSIQGGIQVTITGTGFANAEHIENVEVLFGTAVASVVSTNPTEIVVDLPKTLDSYDAPIKVQVTVNDEVNQDGNNDFQYSIENLPTIDDISPAFASPVMKGTVTINGSNFGTTQEDIQVKLFTEKDVDGVVTRDLSYNLIIQSVTDTQILATLSGGHVGIYKMVVQRNGFGYSIQDVEFSYQIEVQSVSPTTGGVNGGTILTITGQNFSTVKEDNNVFITQGDEMVNDQCVIISASATEIVCTTPPKNSEFDFTPLQIYVQGRLIEESVCTTNNCEFTYVEEETPSLTENQEFNDVNYGDSIQISGSLLDSSDEVLFIFNDDEKTTVSGTSDSETQVSFVVPNINSGDYQVLVQLKDRGYAGIVSLQINAKIDDNLQFSRNVSLGGEDLVITGQGFSVENSQVTVNGKECILTSDVTLTQIQCRSYGTSTNNQQLSIVYKNTLTEESVTKSISNVKHHNNKTPVVTKTNPKFESQINVQGSFDITIQESQNLDQGTITAFLSHKGDYNIQYQAVVSSQTLTFENVPLGVYVLNIHVDGLGYALLQDQSLVDVEIVTQNGNKFSISNTETSLTGGNLLTISGDGFDTQNLQNNEILVCGYKCQVQDSTVFDNLECILPQVNTVYLKNDQKMNTKPSQNQVQIINNSLFGPPIVVNQGSGSNEEQSAAIAIADNTDNAYMIADEDIQTPYVSSGGNECYIGYDFGENIRFQVDSISYTTKPQGDSQANKFIGGSFQGSNDGVTYDDIYILGNDFSQGSNTWVSEDVTQVYRYVRFFNSVESGQAYCGFTDLQMKGWNYYKEEISTESDFDCDVIINVNNEQSVVEEVVNYKADITPIVTDIQPNYGWQLGGTEVTISGEKFGTVVNNASVIIDGIECSVTSVSDNEIVCTTGDKGANNCAEQSLKVSINGYKAIVPDHVKFYYGLLWSRDETWGLEIAPRAGDSVYVGQCKTLIVDEDTPKHIFSILVEYGTIFFADNGDRQFHAQYFIVRKGKLIIGSEQQPHTSNLEITLYGNYWDKQLPDYGVKVIACYKCILDIHGSPKTPTWSSIQATVDVGDNSLQLLETTNWQIGDLIAIATTDYDGRHSEDVVITSITYQDEGDLIEFSPALQYQHISVIEDYDGVELKMQAEVGNLSRNIVIQGDPNDDVEERFGGQLMLHGHGSEGRIENTEFRYVGQPRIIGRYTMHFHMVGDCKYSYIRGNAVHKSYARVVALHDIHHLRVQNNVGYKVKGHNIFLENGIETHNVIEGNLLISPRSVFNMLQTDITVAGIWATNPQNYVRYNHIAGSQFYGLWYEIFERPESPHVTNDICPMGLPVFQLEHNVAHSNQRFGLRFFRLQPRTYPCEPIRNDSLEDPWSQNPSIQATFSNHTLYKNGESGVLAEELGNSIFSDFIMADNYHAGFQAHLANFTREEVIFENSIVIGRSQNNADSIDFHKKAESTAILAPRTDGFRARNIKVYNFDEGTSILKVSSQNNFAALLVQGGKTTIVEGISTFNSDNAAKLKWLGPRKNLVYDVDGSLSGTGKPTYITPFEKHLNQAVKDGGCDYDSDTIAKFDDSVVCSETTLRTIQIGNLQKKNSFKEQNIRVFNLNDNELCFNNTGGCQETLSDFSNTKQLMIENEAMDGDGQYSNVYAQGYAYNVHWNSDLDWTTLLVYLPQIYDVSDKTMILRFNFTEQRELFDVYNFKLKKITDMYTQSSQIERFYDQSTGLPNNGNDGCTLGEYYIDYDYRTVSLCINNKGRTTPYQSVQMNGVYCRHTCPVYGLDCEKEQGNLRQFSETTQWENVAMRKRPHEEEFVEGVPQEGDDVIIPCEWTMVFNVAEFTFGTLYIDGTLKIDPNIPVTTIKANNIWIRSGKLLAGESEQFPYKNQLNIELYGNRYSPPILIDDFSKTGTKSLAVTGQMILYGQIPETTQTRLGLSANIGDTTITVDKDTDISGWKQGDEIILGGSSINGSGFEKVTIDSISGQQITLQSSLEFFHYGAEKRTIGNEEDDVYVQVEERYGKGLDMRTTVGHITRNIKIYGTDEDETGGHLQVYHWKFFEETEKSTTDIDVRGNIVLSGVELENMGQVNSENGGVHIISTKSEEGEQTIIKGSSIHDCMGMCVNLIQTNNIEITNNVIYNGQQFLIASYGFVNQQITNNLLVGVTPNPYQAGGEPPTFIYMYENYDPENDNILVKGNVGQSSSGLGFAFPSILCSQQENSKFEENETGNAKEVGIIYNMSTGGCRYGGNNAIYHSQEGISVHSAGTTSRGWLLQKHIIIECGTGIIMRSGNNNERTHYNELRDAYVSAMLLDEICPECYNAQNNGANFRCSGQFGAQLLLTNMIGNTCPLTNGALALKALCNVPTAFSEMFIYDTEFVNYRKVYDEFDYGHLQEGHSCANNKVFKTNVLADEATAAHYLRNVKCTNCHRDGLFFLHEPNPLFRGWFGGCGNMDCTGMENVMVQDITGDFLGIPGTVISNNEDVGYGGDMKESCTYVIEWNGFNCTRTDISVLEWESIGPDAQTISTAPVSVSNDQFTNEVNMWKEWEWIGPEPQNRRQNTFTSLILANQVHNITYAGTKSFNLLHKMSQRSPEGENDRFVIIKYHYSNPLTIEVLVQGELVKSFPFKAPENLLDHSTTCGANNYFFQNSTVHFVITNEPSCQVQVRLINHVQINMRIGMSKEEFYSDDAHQTTFINRIQAFLEIPHDRIRIVGIVDNAEKRRMLLTDKSEDYRELSFVITGGEPGTADSNYKEVDEYLSLKELAEKIIESVHKNSLDIGIGVYYGASYEVVVAKQAGVADSDEDFVSELDISGYEKDESKIREAEKEEQIEKQEESNFLVLAISILFGVIFVILMTLLIYHMWKKQQLLKMQRKTVPCDSEVYSEANLDQKQLSQIKGGNGNTTLPMNNTQQPSTINYEDNQFRANTTIQEPDQNDNNNKQMVVETIDQ